MADSKRNSKEDVDRRKRIIDGFLKKYKKEKNTDIFTEDFEQKFRSWEMIKTTGITVKELYECLYNSKGLLELEPKVDEGSIRKNLKNMDYVIKGKYLMKSIPEEDKGIYERLTYAFTENNCIRKYLTVSTIQKILRPQKKSTENLPNIEEGTEYCYVMEFESNERISSIAEDLTYVLVNRIIGITYGFNMIRVYCMYEKDYDFIRNQILKIEKEKY